MSHGARTTVSAGRVARRCHKLGHTEEDARMGRGRSLGPCSSLLFFFSFPFSFLFIFEFLNLNPNSIVNFEFELDALVQDVDMK
jgi:hypothetical protein